MISENWADLLEPGLRRVFDQAIGRNKSMIPLLFNTVSSKKAAEHDTSYGALGTSGWNFEDSDTVQYGDFNQGYKVTATHVEFARGIQIKRKLYDDEQYGVMAKAARILADSAFSQREKAAAGVFINAFTDSGTTGEGFPIAGYDSVGLCSAAHPYSEYDSTAQNNESTLSLTKANVAATRQAMMAFTDDKGDLINIVPDVLLVPPELEDDALVIVKSTQDPASANNAINPQAGRFQVVVWNYLTDSNSWFTIDKGTMKEHLIWYNRIPLEFKQEENFDSIVAKYRAYMRYSRIWTNYIWVYGNNPS